MKNKKIKKAKVKAPLTVKIKRDGKEVDTRVYMNTPHGFKKDDGATTQPLGTVIADNGKSLFATTPNGKPERKQVIVLKDKDAFSAKRGKQPKSEKVKTETKTAVNKSSEKAGSNKVDKLAAKTKISTPTRNTASPKVNVSKPTVTKISQKTAGKSTSASNNSVRTSVSASQLKAPSAISKKSEQTTEKRRVYKSLPKGYSVVKGTVAQSDGTILIHNGKPLFKQGKNGKPQQVKDSHGKPAHKIAKLIVDEKAFHQAKNAERQLVDVEIRKHNDSKGGHPHIMVDTVGDKNVSVGITHDKYKGKKHANIPLEVNPLSENRQAYMRKQGTVDRKENYSTAAQTGKMTVTDNAKAKQIGERAKQKELNKQPSKK